MGISEEAMSELGFEGCIGVFRADRQGKGTLVRGDIMCRDRGMHRPGVGGP